ncbi:MAG: hypothetical protein JWO03_228 [Bacteroidetes bacterium]|nr:hypothetical protein [Bacteroidota bacterium]
MKTITIYLQSELDSARVMKALHNTPFEGPIEAYEMDEAISDDEIDAFEDRLDAYHEQPDSEANYLRFKSEMQDNYGIGVLIKNP